MRVDSAFSNQVVPGNYGRIAQDLQSICFSIVLQFLRVRLQHISAVLLNKSLSCIMCGKQMEWLLWFYKVLKLLLEHRNSEILTDHSTNTNCSDTGRSKVWILIEARDFFYSLQHPDRLWSPPILLFYVYCGSFWVVKRLGWAVNWSPALVLKWRMSGATLLLSLYAFMAWTRKASLFSLQWYEVITLCVSMQCV